MVLFVITMAFMYSIGQSLDKYLAMQIGETQGTKRAAEMSFPSLAIVPVFDSSYSLPRVKGTKNLTEYYENRVPIADKILMLKQSYESENG